MPNQQDQQRYRQVAAELRPQFDDKLPPGDPGRTHTVLTAAVRDLFETSLIPGMVEVKKGEEAILDGRKELLASALDLLEAKGIDFRELWVTLLCAQIDYYANLPEQVLDIVRELETERRYLCKMLPDLLDRFQEYCIGSLVYLPANVHKHILKTVIAIDRVLRLFPAPDLELLPDPELVNPLLFPHLGEDSTGRRETAGQPRMSWKAELTRRLAALDVSSELRIQLAMAIGLIPYSPDR